MAQQQQRHQHGGKRINGGSIAGIWRKWPLASIAAPSAAAA